MYLTVIVRWFLCFPNQDEQYIHLDELEVTQVEKQVNDAMAWMNNKMNQQNSQDLTLDPVVKVQEIQAKAKVERSTQFKKTKTKVVWKSKRCGYILSSSPTECLLSFCSGALFCLQPRGVQTQTQGGAS